MSPEKAEQIRSATRRYVAGLDDNEDMQWTVAKDARVKRAPEPEITGEYGHYVRVEYWFYLGAGVEGA